MATVPYEIHVFVCQNERPAGHPRGDCAGKGSAELHAALKVAVKEGCPGRNIRVNKSGCLDTCEQGVSVAVYPAAVWYGGVTVADIPELVARHFGEGRPLDRLRIDVPGR